MGIKGFQGTSLLDYPGKIAALVFYGGCNLRCSYCHNPSLVEDPDQYPDYPLDELFAELEQRRRFLDGVVVSGGEPLVQADLESFLERVKGLGLLTKVDTNGTEPRRLQKLIEKGLIDYVAVDLKTSPERYDELGGDAGADAALEETVAMLIASGVDHEFRTTCVPGLVGKAEIRRLGEMIRGGRRWFLQQFRSDILLEPESAPDPYRPADLRALADIAGTLVKEVRVRGL